MSQIMPSSEVRDLRFFYRQFEPSPRIVERLTKLRVKASTIAWPLLPKCEQGLLTGFAHRNFTITPVLRLVQIDPIAPQMILPTTPRRTAPPFRIPVLKATVRQDRDLENYERLSGAATLPRVIGIECVLHSPCVASRVALD